MNTLFSINYLGSVQYWAHLWAASHPILDPNCFFERQSYRNRCHILASNGVLALSVPVVKPQKNRTTIKDALLSYDTNWRSNHWKSIVSAYRNSPFFEYYADDYEAVYRNRYKFLWDFDMTLMEIVCSQLSIPNRWTIVADYQTATIGDLDLREALHPKRAWQDDASFSPAPYYQVFGEKFGFTPNLSVIDLIFNKGPESALHLQNCIGRR